MTYPKLQRNEIYVEKRKQTLKPPSRAKQEELLERLLQLNLERSQPKT
jgi:hypothetical protein